MISLEKLDCWFDDKPAWRIRFARLHAHLIWGPPCGSPLKAILAWLRFQIPYLFQRKPRCWVVEVKEGRGWQWIASCSSESRARQLAADLTDEGDQSRVRFR